MKRTYSHDEAADIATRLGIDFTAVGFGLDQFQAGLNIEAEHGGADASTNVTDDDPLTTGKIALAHLNEMPDYYTRLKSMEAQAEAPQAEETARSCCGGRALKVGVMTAVGFGLLLIPLSKLLRHKAQP